MSTYDDKEMEYRVAKVRREARARADAIGRLKDPDFHSRERAYAAQHPRLMPHRHCGLADDSDRPRTRVVLPNGHVIYSTWYRVPTTEADARLALKEQLWLLDNVACP